ncbi:hypothetical protein PS15m_000390 [Mucor circinelloides]
MSLSQTTRTHGNIFHQRRPSLTTSCPPPDKRKSFDLNKRRGSSQYALKTNRKSWVNKVFDMPAIQLVGWTYVLICFCLSTIHLVRSFSLLDPTNSVRGPQVDWDKILMEKQQATPWSQLDDILPETRLSKMFSKSIVNNGFIRPYWFTASIRPPKETLTLATVVEFRDLEYLIQLAEMYEGPISATLLVPSTENINHELSIQQLTDIRNEYETTIALKRHVDIHLVLQPGGLTESGQVIATGGYQEARNLARLFSRTNYVALVPVATLWMTDIAQSFKSHLHLLQAGDLLVIPTFGFPNYEGVDTKSWPMDKQSMIEWVEGGDMGLLDYNYELNNGPTSYSTWKDAKEPYLVPNYDYNYGPIFISTKLNHPWCEERFEDHLASCVYNAYLAGANLWVSNTDFAVRTGQEPADTLYTPQQRKIQNKIARKYRIEQCVFYARQFDQYGTFNSERAEHVKQECSKALLSLQKEKMISDIVAAEQPKY